MDDASPLTKPSALPDAETFQHWFNAHARSVFTFLYLLVGRREVAEELTQETFARAYEHRATLRDRDRVAAWLFGIARNVSREHVREYHRWDSLDDVFDDDSQPASGDERLPDAALLEAELRFVVRSALAKLDADKRMVFILRTFEQCSYEDIAAITGSSIGKVKTDLHRARLEMRRHVRPYLSVGQGGD
ncbi:MAG: RNA polymerase sigma factor [Chloracidobacterium sp.]|uniref:RNA polymerase sigma factor n=1 Tax=Chloracidobacterium validum TaxID=2821543 RepID=A0ABX8BGA0_9BACT|nr:RNA polymerase sigma factor [Chloracidobacterium validum]QUW04618.1 RNA polymerase sigma factor [Chloracidobacterium validum]